VRWTEQRNFEAVLDMLSARQIDVQPLISHRFPFAQATAAYELIGSREPSLGVLLDFPAGDAESLRAATIRFPFQPPRRRAPQSPVVGVLGAGVFATRQLFPALRAEQARLKWVATRSGVSAVSAAKKFQVERATSDAELVLADPDVNVVVIATRHDSHADYVCRALDAGKHVFVEKPLALDRTQLVQIQRALTAAQHRGANPLVMAGFNRRFAPHVVKMVELLRTVCEPKTLLVTVNAGEVPPDHWLHDPHRGGGRMIGEGCHFIDLLRFLVGHPITQMHAVEIGGSTRHGVRDDKVLCTLQFADGSLGAIHYLASGHRSFPKERVEVFAGGRVLQLDNFRRLIGYGWPTFGRWGSWKQDKGHRAEVAVFLKAVRDGGAAPIPWHELVEVACVTADAAGAAKAGGTMRYLTPAGVDAERSEEEPIAA
jgi:predicted dehydrogenase